MGFKMPQTMYHVRKAMGYGHWTCLRAMSKILNKVNRIKMILRNKIENGLA